MSLPHICISLRATRRISLAKQREYLLAGMHALMSGNLYAAGDAGESTGIWAILRTMPKRSMRWFRPRVPPTISRAPFIMPNACCTSPGWAGRGLVAAARSGADRNLECGCGFRDGADRLIDGIRPYNAKHYELAYEVFIENHNLNEAFRVAEAAVRQVPEETIWHKRWRRWRNGSGKPEVALREWRWLLHHDDSREALLAVLRLAPSLNDYDALLDAWKLVATTGKRWMRSNGRILATCSSRPDGSAKASSTSSSVMPPIICRCNWKSPRVWRSAAGMTSMPTACISACSSATATSPEWLMKIANLYLRKGEYRKAYDLLQTNRDKVG